MKYLSDYMEERQSALFKKTKTFFAFSQKQLEEGLAETKQTTKDIISMGAGMYCAKDHADFLVESLDYIYKDSIKTDISENGIDGIIDRELANHEAFYTMDTESTLEALADYPITSGQVNTRFNMKRYDPETNMNVSV